MGEGKFYCNGLDLPWLARMAQRDPRHGIDFRDNYMQKLLSKLLTFPVPTVAALNGDSTFVAERSILSSFSATLLHRMRYVWLLIINCTFFL